jgi:hypothetical protein
MLLWWPFYGYFRCSNVSFYCRVFLLAFSIYFHRRHCSRRIGIFWLFFQTDGLTLVLTSYFGTMRVHCVTLDAPLFPWGTRRETLATVGGLLPLLPQGGDARQSPCSVGDTISPSHVRRTTQTMCDLLRWGRLDNGEQRRCAWAARWLEAKKTARSPRWLLGKWVPSDGHGGPPSPSRVVRPNRQRRMSGLVARSRRGRGSIVVQWRRSQALAIGRFWQPHGNAPSPGHPGLGFGWFEAMAQWATWGLRRQKWTYMMMIGEAAVVQWLWLLCVIPRSNGSGRRQGVYLPHLWDVAPGESQDLASWIGNGGILGIASLLEASL